MDSVQEFGRILSIIAWCSFMIIASYQFTKGMFDFKSLLKLFGVVVAIGLGYELIQLVLSSAKPDTEPLICTRGQNYLNCAGWPIFSSTLAYIAEKVLKFSSWAYAFSAGVIQLIAGIFYFLNLRKQFGQLNLKRYF